MALRHGRRGFTLIEILVVIGIILVLMSMVVLGFRHLNYTAARRETIAELHLCRDLLTEYENTAGLNAIEGLKGSVGNGYDPVYVDPNTGTEPDAFLKPDDAGGDMGDKSKGSSRYESPAVVKTQGVPAGAPGVMYVLLRDPKNRAAVAGVTPKRLLEPEPTGNSNTPPSPNTLDNTVLLDGWGNPIIFVPRGGMHIFVNGTPYIVRSTGTFPASDVTNHPITPADRPFFASAGQDGFFVDQNQGRADYSIDNIYSFQD